MEKFLLLILVTGFIQFAVCMPQNLNYDSVIDGISNMQEDDDISNDYSYEPAADFTNGRYIRDTSEKNEVINVNASSPKPIFSLADLLSGVENSILQSALTVASIFQPNQNLSENKSEINSIEQLTKKRSAERSLKREDKSTKENTTSIYSPGGSNEKEHIAVDHIVAYKVHDFPLFSLFPGGLQKNVIARSVNTSQNTTENGSTTKLPEMISPGDDAVDMSTVHDNKNQEQPLTESAASVTSLVPTTVITTTLSPSTTTTTATTTTTTTTSPPTTITTTKEPIKELKEKEEQIKDKVAEIEADPIILTARV